MNAVLLSPKTSIQQLQLHSTVRTKIAAAGEAFLQKLGDNK